MILKAPWTEEQVANLNTYQESGIFHPYTCGKDSRHRDLVATTDGWVCLDCDYKQDWCHEHIAQLPLQRLEVIRQYMRELPNEH